MVCQNVRDLFEDTTLIDSILEYEFDRLIILGAGSLKGIAREMSLKILELTAGQVNANYDTPLGFRHGPKSVINDKTLTIVLRQNEQYAVAYDEDLISELRREQKKNRVVVLRNDVQQEGDVS
ncbi:MAG: SIS domain-containing protein, partial [Turicibacter sp.]